MASKQRCLFCGEQVGEKGYCTGCRLNQKHLVKAFNTSIYHYNKGYEKAIERDISGAIESLQTALRYNKQNINARNLLGLCYYEMGETVSAMEHWVMSINYKPKDNDAARYLKEIRDDEEELEMTGLSIKAYNDALAKAKKGDLDGALSDLRGSISNNPNFVRALKKLIRGKDSVIADMEILRSTAADVAGPESEMVGIEAEIDSLSERLQLLIAENARIAQDQSDYEKRYRELMERYEERKRRHTELTEQIAKAKAADKIIGHFIDLLWQMNEAEIDFDENLWGGMVESITVHSKEKVTVTFKGGYKVKVIE